METLSDFEKFQITEKQIHIMSDPSLTRDRPVSLWVYSVFLTKKERV